MGFISISILTIGKWRLKEVKLFSPGWAISRRQSWHAQWAGSDWFKKETHPVGWSNWLLHRSVLGHEGTQKGKNKSSGPCRRSPRPSSLGIFSYEVTNWEILPGISLVRTRVPHFTKFLQERSCLHPASTHWWAFWYLETIRISIVMVHGWFKASSCCLSHCLLLNVTGWRQIGECHTSPLNTLPAHLPLWYVGTRWQDLSLLYVFIYLF